MYIYIDIYMCVCMCVCVCVCVCVYIDILDSIHAYILICIKANISTLLFTYLYHFFVSEVLSLENKSIRTFRL